MKISSTTLGCPDWPLETILERFVEYGYDALDFRGLDGQMELWRLDDFSAAADQTATRIAASGLAVSGFSSSARMFNLDPAAAETALMEVREYARLCRLFGAPMIRVFGGRLEKTPWKKAIAAAVETLKKMADVAGEGVTVAVETHDDWIHSAPLAEVMDKADLPNVGVLWDLHHPYRMAGESPRQTYDNIGRYTVATHLKDSRELGGGKCEYCLGGEGDVPLAEMVSLLARGGYDGYLTLEWEKKWHPELPEPEVALPQHAAYMRKLIEQA